MVVREARKVKRVEIWRGGRGVSFFGFLFGLGGFLEGEEAYNRHNPSTQAPPSTADSQQAHDDGDDGRPERDLVRDEIPFGDATVHRHSLGSRVSQHLILEILRVALSIVDRARDGIVRVARAGRLVRRSRSVEAELLDRVEDEVGVSLAAPVDVAGGLVGGAVVPEVDAVCLFQAAGALSELQRGCELGLVGQIPGICGGEVAEVGGHEVVVVEGRAGGPAGDFEAGEGDEGGDGEGHWREDTRDATGFAHGCGLCWRGVGWVKVLLCSPVFKSDDVCLFGRME